MEKYQGVWMLEPSCMLENLATRTLRCSVLCSEKAKKVKSFCMLKRLALHPEISRGNHQHAQGVPMVVFGCHDFLCQR